MKLFSSTNAKIFRLTATGVTMLLLAALVIVCDPLRMIVDSELSFRAGSLIYKVWQKPPLDVLLHVYMFNVTNLEAFKRGRDAKLQLAEVGPYVYQEFLEHHNVTFNANNTVTFTPRRTVRFVRERSVGDPATDRIVAPNIPYMGVTSAASDKSYLAAMGVKTLTGLLNSQAMLEMSVHDYLWGYEDRLVSLASKIVPQVINFQRFGLLERMFDEGYNVVTMALPPKTAQPPPAPGAPASAVRGYSIDNWNGLRGMKTWGYQEQANQTVCNSLHGAYDGTLFPRHISKGEVFRVYRKAFCRTLPITFSHAGAFNGVAAYNFKLADTAFDSDLHDPASACFCSGQKCLKKGLGNITPCYYNIPLAISFPHFFNADPSLLEPLEGLDPDEAKHGTEVAIQPRLGILMRVHTRFQINLLMGDIKFNSEMRRFQHMVLPIFWLDIGVEGLTPDLVLLLQLIDKVLPYVQLGVVVALLVAGVALLGRALVLSCRAPAPWRHSLNRTVESTLMPNAVILPLIRKGSKQFPRLQEQQEQPLLA